MRVLSNIPFLTVAGLIFNLVLLSNRAAFDPRAVPAFSFRLPSGAFWYAAPGQFIVILAVVCLVLDVIKLHWSKSVGLLGRIFSLVIFFVLLIEFLFWKPAGNATCVLLMFTVLTYAATSFLISPTKTNRDFGIGGIH